ncbi:MAG: hypothetical protein R3D25_18280 [Geminicoccaceae bacterium]
MNQIFEILVDINKTGVAILMVEQNAAKQALCIADHGVLAMGENRHEGTGAEHSPTPRWPRCFRR